MLTWSQRNRGSVWCSRSVAHSILCTCHIRRHCRVYIDCHQHISSSYGCSCQRPLGAGDSAVALLPSFISLSFQGLGPRAFPSSTPCAAARDSSRPQFASFIFKNKPPAGTCSDQDISLSLANLLRVSISACSVYGRSDTFVQVSISIHSHATLQIDSSCSSLVVGALCLRHKHWR